MSFLLYAEVTARGVLAPVRKELLRVADVTTYNIVYLSVPLFLQIISSYASRRKILDGLGNCN